ncbi:uncharacterized protein G2W53_041786 [Senna tora]|uniref:Uncharacterized protein n=1 Tax=Senna tora TaxID=362788 RepID=A0A834SEB2_9FABA|nr:uncharacterized protein G2W53_041786 [Senna tora]
MSSFSSSGFPPGVVDPSLPVISLLDDGYSQHHPFTHPRTHRGPGNRGFFIQAPSTGRALSLEGGCPSERGAPPSFLSYVPLPGLFLPDGVFGVLVWDISLATDSMLIHVVEELLPSVLILLDTRSRFSFPLGQLVQGLGYAGVIFGRLRTLGEIWVYLGLVR